MNIGLVCEGDASVSETVFSGTAKGMYLSLMDKGFQVHPIDASLKPFERAAAAAFSFSPDRMKWRSKFRYGNQAARFRTNAAHRSIKKKPVEVVLQIGASFDPPAGLPYAIYSDWNMALDAVEAKSAKGVSRGLAVTELESIGKDHARRYRSAAMIFTISERLRQSFIDLYEIHPDRVMTAYAGPNFDIKLIDEILAEPKPVGPPTVLFIAKEFRRKGGDVLTSAFRELQQSLPEARLLFAGASKLPVELEGLKNVEHLGLLDKTNPKELRLLLAAYRRADLLVLPSRHDPFPTVIREAMFFGLPCVATDIWAMSEMIQDGVTGYLVPPESPERLAACMERILVDPVLRQSMGNAARKRAEQMFSWQAVGYALQAGIQRIHQGARN